MKTLVRPELIYWFVALIISFLMSCQGPSPSDTLAINSSTSEVLSSEVKEPSQQFKDYWYAGEAEITSYELSQARYGELRDGKAVLIYVTEDFRPDTQVKADFRKDGDISVLKLNATKNFNTGVYPYSVMQSTFYPVQNESHAIKVTASMQEWCGHVFAQVNNRDKFEINAYSYFESEGDQSFSITKDILENELWTQLRIDPSSLPTGSLNIVPSMEYIRLSHIPFKAYQAEATLGDGTYTLNFPELKRELSISFNTVFPYDILGWTEKTKRGQNGKYITTTATKLSQIKSPYWSKNSNSDSDLRKTLKLE